MKIVLYGGWKKKSIYLRYKQTTFQIYLRCTCIEIAKNKTFFYRIVCLRRYIIEKRISKDVLPMMKYIIGIHVHIPI